MTHALWYATRATGVVALILLTITVALGIAGVSRLQSAQWPRLVTALLHKNIALLVTAFIGIHIATTLLDSFVNVSPVAAIVPFASSYRPFWLGLGTIAFDLILALIATSLLRGRLCVPGVAGSAHHGLRIMAGRAVAWPGHRYRRQTAVVARAGWPLRADGSVRASLASPPDGPGNLAGRRPDRNRRGANRDGGLRDRRSAAQRISASGRNCPTLLGGHSNHGGGRGRWISFTGHAAVSGKPGSGHEVITILASTTASYARQLTVVLAGTKDGGGIAMSAGSVRIAAAGVSPWPAR